LDDPPQQTQLPYEKSYKENMRDSLVFQVVFAESFGIAQGGHALSEELQKQWVDVFTELNHISRKTAYGILEEAKHILSRTGVLDDLLSGCSEGYSLDRVTKLELGILRCAASRHLAQKEDSIPYAMELCKKYGAETSFVYAVLKTLNEREAPGDPPQGS